MQKPRLGQLPSALKMRVLNKSNYYLQAFIHLFHVQILPQVTRWRRTKEVPKVAIYQNRVIATLHSLLDIVPVVATLVFLILNIRGCHVGHMSTATIAAIQFAAKVLEISIQASLAGISLSLIRHEAFAGRNLPLGLLFAPLNTVRASYVWSLELWGFLTANNLQNWRKAILSILIPATVILAILVGPSSAVLMIPRTINYPVRQNLIVLDDTATMFPHIIDQSVSANLTGDETIRAALLQLAQHEKHSADQIYDGSGSRRFVFGPYEDRANMSSQWTSIPNRRVSHALADSVSKDVDFVTTKSLQPVVVTTCWYNSFSPNDDPKSTYFTIGDGSQHGLKDLISFTGFEEMGTTQKIPFPPRNVANTDHYTLLWQQTPASVSNHSLICIDAFKNNTSGEYGYPQTACTVDAYWARASVNYTLSAKLAVPRFNGNQRPEAIGGPISIAVDWVEKLTQEWFDVARNLPNFGTCDAASWILATGISDAVPIPGSCIGLDKSGYPKDNFLYSIDIGNCPVEQLEKFSREYVPAKGLHKQYDTIVLAVTNPSTDPQDYTQLVVQEYIHGYGYDSSEIPVQLSLAVVATYVLIAVTYILYTLVTGRTANSWNSISELFMLGVNSKKPEHLEGTSVGIDTLSTFREPVSIRVNEQGSVELVFENDTGLSKRRLRDVEPNEAY